MIKYITSLFLMLVLLASLQSVNIDIQNRRLEYIRGLIDQKRAELEESREQKENVSRKKDDYEANLDERFINIQNLNSTELELIHDIISAEHSIVILSDNINRLNNLCSNKISRFYVNKFTESDEYLAAIEEVYFPFLINSLQAHIANNRSALDSAASMLQDGRGKRQQVVSQKEQQQKASRLLLTEIDNLYQELDSLTKEEASYLAEVERLERNRIALEALIDQLQSDEHSVSYKFTGDKLLWPIKGEIANRFGEIRDETNRLTLINNGIDIITNEQQAVCAVDFGIVVFAETFRNYGRLVIIDHLNGYFSLYANNGSMLVAKGDNVSLGQEIAITGKDTNNDRYLLHFELRRHNRAVDPLDYLE